MSSPFTINSTRTGAICQVDFSEYREKVADWLNGFNWDWWATFTFRYACNPYSAKKSFIRFIKGKGIDYFYASEWCGDYHGVHIHALMGNCTDRNGNDIRRLTTMDKWHEKYGYARIWPYDKHRGARFYVCKYIVKSVADWDIKITERLPHQTNFEKILLDKNDKVSYNPEQRG